MLSDLKDMMKLHREYNRRYSKVVNQPKPNPTARWTIDQKGLDVFRAYTSLKKSLDELACNTDQPGVNMQEEFGCTSSVRFNTSPLRDPQFNRIKRPNYGVDGVDANTIYMLLSDRPKSTSMPFRRPGPLEDSIRRQSEKQHNDSQGKYDMLDVHEELTDILKVYQEGHKNLVDQEEYRLHSLVHCMREFLHVHDQREKMEGKLTALASKLAPKECEDCGCGCDEEEE